MSSFDPLPLEQTIGFNGTIPEGYKVHPDGRHIVYAVGCNLIVSEMGGSQEFLIGHTGHVTCFAISPLGTFIASGEETATGFPAYIIIWDFKTKQQLFKLKQHQAKVQGLSFSPSEKYMVSLGGRDDKNVVVWNVEEGRAICGSPVGIEPANFVHFFNQSDESFFTSGECQPRVWDIDYANTKLIPHDIQMGHFRRVGLCAVIDEVDELAYLGTSTGDIIVIDVQNYILKHTGPSKESNRLASGCTSIALFTMGQKGAALCCGSGTGDIFCYSIPEPANAQRPLLINVGKVKVLGTVTSINVRPAVPKPAVAPTPTTSPTRTTRSVKPTATQATATKTRTKGHGVIPMATAERALIPRQKEAVRPPTLTPKPTGPEWEAIVGTAQGNVYSVILPSMAASLKGTCHSASVNSVCFPENTSEIFASCSSSGDIRLWHLPTGNELLRIEVPNQECLCCCFNLEGTEIISGWSDGKIRAFGPETGRLLYVINDAHKRVTAITTYRQTPKMIISGGSEGQVRVWQGSRDGFTYTLASTLKEHRTKVNSVKVSDDDTECVSCSDDGTTYTWRLCSEPAEGSASVFASQYVRLKQMMKHANFLGVDYLRPDCCQIVVCGSDRMVTYYDSVDGSKIRELELSDQEILDVAVDPTGTLLACVGNDKLVKIVDYDEGKIVLLGEGHPERINCCCWSPDGLHLVTGSCDGSVFVWTLA